jgi:hypothetical protein
MVRNKANTFARVRGGLAFTEESAGGGVGIASKLEEKVAGVI